MDLIHPFSPDSLFIHIYIKQNNEDSILHSLTHSHTQRETETKANQIHHISCIVYILSTTLTSSASAHIHIRH